MSIEAALDGHLVTVYDWGNSLLGSYPKTIRCRTALPSFLPSS